MKFIKFYGCDKIEAAEHVLLRPSMYTPLTLLGAKRSVDGRRWWTRFLN